MTEVDLTVLSRDLFDVVVSRALLGVFVPGLTWIVQDDVPERGPATVRFAVDGDLTHALGLLDLPDYVRSAIADRATIEVRGRVSLQLEEAELASLRGMLGSPDEPKDPTLLDAYAQGLDLTGRTLDQLEQRALGDAGQTRKDLRIDLETAGFEGEGVTTVLGILDPPTRALQQRFKDRRGRLASLRAELLALDDEGADVATGLERVLGEEYALLAEAEADLAAFETALRRAREAAVERFTR